MKCLLCKREISERKIVYGGRWRDEERQLPLCRFHYGAYMAHGLKKLEKEHWLDKGVGGETEMKKGRVLWRGWAIVGKCNEYKPFLFKMAPKLWKDLAVRVVLVEEGKPE